MDKDDVTLEDVYPFLNEGLKLWVDEIIAHSDELLGMEGDINSNIGYIEDRYAIPIPNDDFLWDTLGIDIVNLVVNEIISFGKPYINESILKPKSSQQIETDIDKLEDADAIKKALLDACERGDTRSVQLFLKKGVDIHMQAELPFRVACAYSQTDLIHYFLNIGVDVNASKSYAIRFAAADNNIKVAKILIDNGANVSELNNDALEKAIERNYKGMANLLIQHGANANRDSMVHCISNNKEELFDIILPTVNSQAILDLSLWLSTRYSRVEMVKKLLKSGADVGAIKNIEAIENTEIRRILKNFIKFGKLNESVLSPKSKEEIQSSLQSLNYGQLVNSTCHYVMSQNLEILKTVLTYKFDDKVFLNTILEFAVKTKSNKSVKLIFEMGVKPYGKLLVGAVEQSRNYQMVSTLLNNGVDVHFDDDHALLKSCWNGQHDYMELLLMHGANPNARDGEILLRAVRMGDEEAVNILLVYGADPNIRDGYALHVSKLLGYKKIEEMLKNNM